MKFPNFYKLAFLEIKDKDVKGTVIFNPDHEIFKGHFPGQPIVPGVCMVRIVKDVLETVTGNKLWLRESKQIKFLQLLIPDRLKPLSLELHLETEETICHVIGRLSDYQGVLFKFQGKFAPAFS